MSSSLLSKPAFDQADPAQLAVLRERPISYLADIDYGVLSEEPLEVSQLVESTRLDRACEQRYFQQMNLAFCRASELRERLLRGDAPQWLVDEGLRLLRRGLRIRNGLAVVYRKLALSIARSYVSPRFPWDELASEAQATLLYAISKFNPDRGYRFSTYATHAIRRRLARYVRQQTQRSEVIVDFHACRLPETRKWTFGYERKVSRQLAAVEHLLRGLAPRDRYILRARFGWGREFEPRTLQQVADEFGVSRERIRQLESRALGKLRQEAAALGIDD